MSDDELQDLLDSLADSARRVRIMHTEAVNRLLRGTFVGFTVWMPRNDEERKLCRTLMRDGLHMVWKNDRDFEVFHLVDGVQREPDRKDFRTLSERLVSVNDAVEEMKDEFFEGILFFSGTLTVSMQDMVLIRLGLD